MYRMDIKRSWNVPLTIGFDSGSSGNLKIIPILAGLMIALTTLFHANSNKTNNIQSDHQHPCEGFYCSFNPSDFRSSLHDAPGSMDEVSEAGRGLDKELGVVYVDFLHKFVQWRNKKLKKTLPSVKNDDVWKFGDKVYYSEKGGGVIGHGGMETR